MSFILYVALFLFLAGIEILFVWWLTHTVKLAREGIKNREPGLMAFGAGYTLIVSALILGLAALLHIIATNTTIS